MNSVWLTVEEPSDDEFDDYFMGVFNSDPSEIARDLPRPTRPGREVLQSNPQPSLKTKEYKVRLEQKMSDPCILEDTRQLGCNFTVSDGLAVMSVF